ncbi:hypothetical protein RFI_29528, partial [Reticulomyxa filosa]
MISKILGWKLTYKSVLQLLIVLIVCFLAASLSSIHRLKDSIHPVNAAFFEKSQTPIENRERDASPRYYLLLGECPNQRYSHSKAFVDSKQWIERLQESNQHWEVHTIAIDTWLSRTYEFGNYSHQDLLDFTKQQLTQLDVTKDKFQWIFSVDCSQIFKHVKPYYMSWYKQNKSESLQLFLSKPSLPPDYPNQLDQLLSSKSNTVFRHAVGVLPSTSIRYLNRWINNSYWDSNILLRPLYYIYIYTYIEYLTLEYNRPLIMEEVGEVFEMNDIRNRDCNDVDINLQRTKSWPRQGCISVLWIQGIFQRDMSYGFKPLQKELYNQ